MIVDLRASTDQAINTLKHPSLNIQSTLKVIPFLLFFLCPFVYTQAYTSIADSLRQNLPPAKDTSYVWALTALSSATEDLDTALAYSQEALALAQNLSFYKGSVWALYQTGEINRLLGHNEEAYKIYSQLIAEGPQLPDPQRWVIIHARRAYALRQMGKSTAAMEDLMRGLHLADSLNFPKERMKLLFELAEIHRLQKDTDRAFYYLDQIDSLYNLNENLHWDCRLKFTRAAIYKIMEREEDKRKGVALMKEMLAGKCQEDMNTIKRAKLLNNLGSLYSSLGELDESEKVLLEALSLKREAGQKVSLSYTLNELSTLCLSQQKYTQAVLYAEEAYQLVKTSNDIFLMHDILHNLYNAYGYLNDFGKAKSYQEERQVIRDSIYNREKVAALAEMQTQYDLAKNEQALALSHQNLIHERERFNTTILIALLLIGFIGGLFLWSRARLKHKALEAHRLKEIDQLKSRFFANISHEFRTPLTLILNALSAQGVNGSHPQMDILRRNALRLKRLIDQMLDLSKLEAGKMKLRPRLCDMEHLLRENLRHFEGLAAQKNIDLQYIAQKAIPKTYVDVDKFEKIISNLLLNALKFTPNGGRVSLELAAEKEHLRLQVKDTGIGISEAALPFIFDRFQRAASTAYEGSGLGLNLVQELIKMHDGEISAESEPGEGTCFSIRWPIGKSPLSEESDVVLEREQPDLLLYPMPNGVSHVVEVGERPIVLLIEDHAELRYQLREQLMQDYQVIEAADGLSGINLAIETIPDLIICDVMMPQKNGYEVSLALKQDIRTNHIPIILLTALASQVDKLKGLTCGVDDYIFKPFDPKELQLRIQNLIEQRRTLRQRYTRTSLLKPNEITGIQKDEQFLQDMIRTIEENLADENFGVEEFSKAVHLSRSQLHRKLKVLAGISPSAFLRQIRLERARQLLQQEAGNVSEVAFRVGFGNIPYFHKCFKAQFGKTPGEVLKSH